MIDFQKLFEDLPEIMPQMDLKKKGNKLYSKFNADGTIPKHSRPDKTVVKILSGVVVAAENGGWGCHRLIELMKLHFSEPQLREIFARYSVENQGVTPHRLPKIDYERQALAVEFLEDCHKYLGKDGDLCNYLNIRGLRIDEIYEKTNIGGYAAENPTACERLRKLCANFDEFQRLNTCKSIVLPLFSRGALSGIAFRYITENQQRKCEKIGLLPRFGGLCFQHALPQKDIDAVCIVEGEFDAISGNLAKLSNTHFVATCGPANAENAVKELRTIYPHADIFAAFDNDNTGSDYTAKFQAFDASIVDIRTAFQPSKDINEFAAKGENFDKIQETIFTHRREIFTKTPTFSEIHAKPEDKGAFTGFALIGKEAVEIRLRAGITIIAAPTGHGKSTILQNIALTLATHRQRVLYITLEESRERVLKYMFSAFSDSETPEDIARFDEILAEFLTVSNYESSVESLAKDIVKENRKTQFTAVFIDYLQLLDTDAKAGTRELAVKEIMRTLRTLADTLSLPIIAAAQFNRTASQDFEKMSLYNIGESGDIERAASVVYSLFQLAKLSDIDTLHEIVNRHNEQTYRRLGLTGGFSQKEISRYSAVEISKRHGAILVRCLKNRFGETDGESVIFVNFQNRKCRQHYETETQQQEIFKTPETQEFTGVSAYECDIY